MFLIVILLILGAVNILLDFFINTMNEWELQHKLDLVRKKYK